MKLGSLFDGSGGFPLAGSLCGIEPVWAAEVEPYPIAVTNSRFPKMRHLGSVTDINGAEIEPVDIITFGSPCQDLSVAGKRAGLKHEANGDEETTRSGLFMEAVRIIKEMREATNGRYPTFAVWENVPGAFSSNKGEDFRIVLEELIKIVEPRAVMPAVPKNGWAYADSYCGDGWSLSYRVFDAQYWGVPQRRRRIYLVLDLRGERARKVLFEREGLRGYFAEGRTPWQGPAGNAQDCAGADDRAGAVGLDGYNQSLTGDKAKALTNAATDSDYIPCVVYGVTPASFYPQMKAESQRFRVDGVANTIVNGTNPGFHNGIVQPVAVMASSAVNAEMTDGSISPCLMARAGTGGNQLPLVAAKTWDCRGNGDGENVSTITGDHENRITDYTSVVCLQGNGIDRADTAGCNGKGWKEDTCYTLNTIDRPAVAYGVETFHCTAEEEKVPTLKARDWKDPHPLVIDRAFFNQGQNAQYDPQYYTDGTVPTLVARGPSAVAVRYIVRRLTPTECARLQGFPDLWGHPDYKEDFTDEEYVFWTDVRCTHAAINGKATKTYTREQMLTWYNKLHTDSAEYKMWGNGIALPCARYVMEGIKEAMDEVL